LDGVAPPAGAAAGKSGPRERLAHVLAVWFGCGHVPYAPGTAGTLGAVPLYLLLRPLGPLCVLLAAAAVTAVGVWAAGIVERRLGSKDPQIVCIDEVAGVLLTLAAAPPGWLGVTVGVVLFRVLDTVKPWPARRLEALPAGWGIVLDDVAAGLWGAAALLLLRATALL
jgi:phosphatidylglycerophosphatase A